jgi:pentatricopeptide repeat protein
VYARIEAASARAPDQADLLAALAVVRNFQRRFDEAKDLYRRVLTKDPRHATALNNLAWLLALTGGHGGEALALVKRATDVTGNDMNLLDTRAVAYLTLGGRDAADLAVKDLQSIVAERPSAVTYFHLAQAYVLAGNLKEARQAWESAKKHGLSPNHVHPLERDTYERLAEKLRS